MDRLSRGPLFFGWSGISSATVGSESLSGPWYGGYSFACNSSACSASLSLLFALSMVSTPISSLTNSLSSISSILDPSISSFASSFFSLSNFSTVSSSPSRGTSTGTNSILAYPLFSSVSIRATSRSRFSFAVFSSFVFGDHLAFQLCLQDVFHKFFVTQVTFFVKLQGLHFQVTYTLSHFPTTTFQLVHKKLFLFFVFFQDFLFSLGGVFGAILFLFTLTRELLSVFLFGVSLLFQCFGVFQFFKRKWGHHFVPFGRVHSGFGRTLRVSFRQKGGARVRGTILGCMGAVVATIFTFNNMDSSKSWVRVL